jgi:hypothetical protein
MSASDCDMVHGDATAAAAALTALQSAASPSMPSPGQSCNPYGRVSTTGYQCNPLNLVLLCPVVIRM